MKLDYEFGNSLSPILSVRCSREYLVGRIYYFWGGNETGQPTNRHASKIYIRGGFMGEVEEGDVFAQTE